MYANATNEKPMTEARRKQLLGMIPAHHRGSDIGTEAAALRENGIDANDPAAVKAFRAGREWQKKQAGQK